MMSELTYHGRELTAEPVNMPLGEVAERLRRREPVVAVLEPGDGTCYQTLLVPCAAPGVQGHLGRIGVPEHESGNYLIVSLIEWRNSETIVVPWDRQIGTHHVDRISANEWTHTFFAWWLTRLRAAFEEAR